MFSLLENNTDEHIKHLCDVADAANNMNFIYPIGEAMNKAIKSQIKNNFRRKYLAIHFAKYSQPDKLIIKWMQEYKTIEKNHKEIVRTSRNLNDSIVRITIKKISESI